MNINSIKEAVNKVITLLIKSVISKLVNFMWSISITLSVSGNTPNSQLK